MPTLPTSLKPQKCRQLNLKSPAPYLGMDTIDSYTNMPVQYAISATDCVASPSGGITLRQGYQQYTTGFSSPVTTLIPYNARNSANSKLFAVSGGSIYDSTASGTIGAAAVTGLSSTNVYWQYAQQVNSVTTYMIMVNGIDYPQMYNGSSRTACSQSSSPSGAGQFSTLDQNSNAVNIQNFIDVELHVGRWWFVCAESTIAYYVNPAAVGGQLYAFDFGSDFPRGGSLQKLISWTIDMGFGVQYNLVAISNQGDIVIYQGDDPSFAAAWNRTGTFQLGAPIGQKCACQLVGDVAYLSQDGLYPLSTYIQSPRVDATSALTYKITPTIQSQIAAYGTTPGWQAIIYPAAKALVLNVPQSSQSQNTQYVFNMIKNIQGWTQFTNWPAACFALFNDELYFGGTNYVALAFEGYQDNVGMDGTGGVGITANVLQAFSDLGVNGYKDVHQIRPFFVSQQPNIAITAGINTDFNIQPPTGVTQSQPATTPGGWGTGNWGAALWGTSTSNPNTWITTNCWPGEYVAVALSFSSSSAVSWVSTDYNVTAGNRFG